MTAAESPGKKKGREPLPRGFMTLWTTVVIDLIGFGVAIPVLGPFARDRFGASGFMVGLIGSSFSAAQFLVARPIGRLSDRVGRKPVLVVSLIGTALASLATGFATSLWMLVAARAFDGASGATVGVAQASVSDIAPPHRRAQLLGMLGAAFGIGFTIGPAIGGLASYLGGRRAPFFVAAAIAGANAIATIIRLPETRGLAVAEAATPAGSDPRLARTWRENSLPRILAVSVLAMFAFSGFENMFSIYGQRRIGFTQSTASIAFVVIGVFLSIVQGGLIRPATERFGERPLLRGGLWLTAGGLLLVGFTTNWWMLVPAILLIALGQGVVSPTTQSAVANRIAPEARGEVLGVQQSWSSAARVLGPLAAGLTFDHIGVQVPMFGAAALFALAAVLAFAIPAFEPRPAT
jgi:MFS transporter, DHA1 family, tetracycline resistance protein